jgi:hypothetical protein
VNILKGFIQIERISDWTGEEDVVFGLFIQSTFAMRGGG